ncbi:hypothetical protein OC846_004923 [Tilletia horrida]|uniref:E3 ubiquitin-protein ligase CCNB1IP1 n=1 Tax=Tilletia horrida TaxID=155126 RepID=A0AAN6GLT8_9BASI|nr:hypothetical protein OC846_004923 [Tilletia horrida]
MRSHSGSPGRRRSLNPSADYRTSVLAGLAPSITMEIATRSISFWVYQKSQEIAGLEKELANEKRKTKDLQDSLRAATKDYDRLKNQLDRNMRKQLLSGGANGDALAAAARPETMAQRQAQSQSILSQPRASIGGTQKPASFWQSQSTDMSTGDDGRAAPSRSLNGDAVPIGTNAAINHGRFQATGRTGNSGDHGMGLNYLNEAEFAGQNTNGRLSEGRPARGDMNEGIYRQPGVRVVPVVQSPAFGQSGMNAGIDMGRQPGVGGGVYASPGTRPGWVSPQAPTHSTFARPKPMSHGHMATLRMPASADGVGLGRLSFSTHAPHAQMRADVRTGGSASLQSTPRGPSAVANFLRSANAAQRASDVRHDHSRG